MLERYRREGAPNPGGRVVAFAVVTLEHGTSHEKRHFFLLPASAGYRIQEGDLTIWAISTMAPIGRQLIRKEVDDEVKLPGDAGTWLIAEIV